MGLAGVMLDPLLRLRNSYARLKQPLQANPHLVEGPMTRPCPVELSPERFLLARRKNNTKSLGQSGVGLVALS
jgi:hypothetical protein